jgi:hypothetical protein
VEENLEISEIVSENKIEAHQEIEKENMELMSLRRSTRVPQRSTRLMDFIFPTIMLLVNIKVS